MKSKYTIQKICTWRLRKKDRIGQLFPCPNFYCLKGLPQNEMNPLFISYFDSWPNARLRGNKHNPRNWVFPTFKVKKPCAEWSTCRPLGLVDQSHQGFFTFKVGKTKFRGLCLSTLSPALGQLSKYDIKRGVISFWGSPFENESVHLQSIFYLLATESDEAASVESLGFIGAELNP